MKAAMSDKVKTWLRDPKTNKELMYALDLLHKNKCQPVKVEIEGKKYIIKLATP